jgi:hypothetical protein
MNGTGLDFANAAIGKFATYAEVGNAPPLLPSRHRTRLLLRRYSL